MSGAGRGVAGVVGLGLIGGSLARDLGAAGWRVLGTDRNAAAEEAARTAGVIEGAVDPGVVDVLVLAVPVRSAPGWLTQLARHLSADAVVTDVGSTKRTVVEAAEAAGLGPRFVGAHPMAGDHRSGWSAARAGLFRGATVWICPAHDAGPDAVRRVEALWRAVGAVPARIDAVEHDRRVAWTSHLPQAAATALANALAAAGVRQADLGPGGNAATRLAGSDPDMWADILTDNADRVEAALERYIGELTRLRRAVAGGEHATARSLLAAARAWSRDEPDQDAGVAAVQRL